MRDLFRFLHRIRSTLMFIGLLVLSLILLYNGNEHHRAQAISSSNAVVGTIFSWRKEITDYASLKEVNRKLAEENAMWRNRHISTYTPLEGLFARIQDTIRQQEYRVITAKVVIRVLSYSWAELAWRAASRAPNAACSLAAISANWAVV